MIVGAWAGTFDGAPTQGIVGMDAAAPLVRDAMLAVADGTRLTLPARPDGIVEVIVCADSGMLAVPSCPQIHDYADCGHEPLPDTWHDELGRVTYPARAAGWLRRRGDTARR